MNHFTGERGVYHLRLRHRQSQPIFDHSKERFQFLSYLAAMARSWRFNVYAVCLLSKEVEVLVKVHKSFALELLDSLKGITLIDDLEQQMDAVTGGQEMLSIVRHIHMRPVYAGVAQHPALCGWTSHRTYVGLERMFGITEEPVLHLFPGKDWTSRRAAYNTYMQCGLYDEQLVQPAKLKTGIDIVQASHGRKTRWFVTRCRHRLRSRVPRVLRTVRQCRFQTKPECRPIRREHPSEGKTVDGR